MNAISDFPPVRYLGKGWWRLEGDFSYQTRFGVLVVPKGFRTDFASVPPLPLSYTLTKNASVVAPTAHDFMYQEGKIGEHRLTREEADDIMYEIMLDEGVNWWQRRMIRFGLRIGGWYVWNRYREEDEEDPKFV